MSLEVFSGRVHLELVRMVDHRISDRVDIIAQRSESTEVIPKTEISFNEDDLWIQTTQTGAYYKSSGLVGKTGRSTPRIPPHRDSGFLDLVTL